MIDLARPGTVFVCVRRLYRRGLQAFCEVTLSKLDGPRIGRSALIRDEYVPYVFPLSESLIHFSTMQSWTHLLF